MERKYNNSHILSFNAKGIDLLGIIFSNIFLSIITLGIYYPWGRAKLLRYKYQSTELDGNNFSFHGTGKEMFLGFLKAIGILITLYSIYFGLIFAGLPIIATIIFIIFIFALIPIIIYGTLRYRLSKTSYREIFFSYKGKLVELIKIYLIHGLLGVISLGLYAPWFSIKYYKEVCKNINYGNIRFEFTGNGYQYFKIIFAGLLLTVVTFGLYLFRYSATLQNYLFNNIQIFDEEDNLKGEFSISLSGWDIFKMGFLNTLLVVFTLGIAYPWVLIRNMNLVFSKLNIHSNIVWESIVLNNIENPSSTGDILGEGLDIQIV